ncbi:MAG: type III pantothenate kinase [Armatimonadetes bacterium]|nr:type III pantothenate kinase [Armatimonadota bacterium]
MTLLVVDIGNTLTKVGIWDGVRIGLVVQRSTNEAGEFIADVNKMAAAHGAEAAPLAVCSVAPDAFQVWAEWAESEHRPLLQVQGDTQTPLVNRYRTPETLGPDRLAAAVAAEHRLGAPVIVVSVGTAVVVDAVSPTREYLGGTVWVGMSLGLDALAAGTRGLPHVSLEEVSTPIGGDTTTSLRTGALHGTAALIEGMVTRMREYLGAEAPVALTGGDADRIASYLRTAHEVFPTLTLEGLALIWEHLHGHSHADR